MKSMRVYQTQFLKPLIHSISPSNKKEGKKENIHL